ncbi:MAG: hypothetical protein LUF30_04625 [Lachnospiraceae bacterium]|nr:hypothetical protein [Lachnospiraceae bacterium]
MSKDMQEKFPGDLIQEQEKFACGFVQEQGRSPNAPTPGFLCPGEQIRAHEFHYFDSTDPGSGFVAKKPVGKRTWECAHVTDHSVAGFPHLYYWSNPAFAARFVESCLSFSRSS